MRSTDITEADGHRKPGGVLEVLAIAAIVFGGLTLVSGGTALFGDVAARTALGNVVGFVLWFNVAAGFVYVAAGLGLWWGRPWGGHLATALALATAGVVGAFGVHVFSGGAFEMRTVGALALRLGFWVVVAVMAKRLTSRHRGFDVEGG